MTTRMPRRRRTSLLVAALALSIAPIATSATSSQATACATAWGSLAEQSAPMVIGPITNVRAGRHECYDRLVLDLRGAAPGYDVRYVAAVYTDGQGAPVPLRGGAKLQIITRAPAYGPGAYHPANARELVDVTGYRTFRQVAFAGSFEGQTTIGLGVRARLPFRVFTLTDSTGSRLVVDVAHTW